jgi:hypothetical protein
MTPVYPYQAFAAGILCGFFLTVLLMMLDRWLVRKFVTRREALDETISTLRRCGAREDFIQRIHKALR